MTPMSPQPSPWTCSTYDRWVLFTNLNFQAEIFGDHVCTWTEVCSLPTTFPPVIREICRQGHCTVCLVYFDFSVFYSTCNVSLLYYRVKAQTKKQKCWRDKWSRGQCSEDFSLVFSSGQFQISLRFFSEVLLEGVSLSVFLNTYKLVLVITPTRFPSYKI